jgi:hypothetical protein
MVVAGLIVELLFAWSGHIPQMTGNLLMEVEQISLNYTTVLNIVFAALVLALLWWAARSKPQDEHSPGSSCKHHSA